MIVDENPKSSAQACCACAAGDNLLPSGWAELVAQPSVTAERAGINTVRVPSVCFRARRICAPENNRALSVRTGDGGRCCVINCMSARIATKSRFIAILGIIGPLLAMRLKRIGFQHRTCRAPRTDLISLLWLSGSAQSAGGKDAAMQGIAGIWAIPGLPADLAVADGFIAVTDAGS